MKQTVDLPNGYTWERHDGAGEIVAPNGEVLFNEVTTARADGLDIRGERDGGSTITVNTQIGTLRESSGGPL